MSDLNCSDSQRKCTFLFSNLFS